MWNFDSKYSIGMIIVIDGPAGSGKSSTAKEVARRCGFRFLDSGAFYRAVTLVYLNHGGQKDLFFDALKSTELDFQYDNDQFRVFVDGEDVTYTIREQRISERVSEVAAMPDARTFVNRLLRDFVKSDNFIADGRDLGTVVFPEAEVKFFLTAGLEERVERRYREMKEQGLPANRPDIFNNLKRRDHLDSTRSEAPLRMADDAIPIDTTSVTFEEQVNMVIERIRNHTKSN